MLNLTDITSKDWIRTAEREPPEGVIVNAMDSSGHVQKLKRRGRLWWFPDDGMYVYYVPSFWQPAEVTRGDKSDSDR